MKEYFAEKRAQHKKADKEESPRKAN